MRSDISFLQMTEDQCREVINNALPGKKVAILKWEFQELGAFIGFQGDHSLLKITVQHNDKKVETLTFFLKSTMRCQHVFKEVHSKTGVFFKEHFLYNNIIGPIQEATGKKLTADCYLSILNHLIVLENLSDLGYESIRLQATDLEHAKLAVTALATFHAGSLIIQQRSGIPIEKMYPEVTESLFIPEDTDRGLICKMLVKIHRDLLETRFDSPDERFLALEWNKSTAVSYARPSKRFKNCILQGDPWGNNFMYKYDENGHPVHTMIVDFQMSRLGPPVLEFLQYISLAFDTPQRKLYYKELMNTYFTTIQKVIIQAGFHPDLVYSRGEFEESLEELAAFGSLCRFFYTPVTEFPVNILMKALKTQEDFAHYLSVGNYDISREAFDTDPVYKRKIQNNFKECFEFFCKPRKSYALD